MLTAAFRISTSRKARIQKKRETKLKRLLYAGWNRKHACVHEWHTQKMVSNASISVAGKLATTGSTSAKSVKTQRSQSTRFARFSSHTLDPRSADSAFRKRRDDSEAEFLVLAGEESKTDPLL